ncbi:YheC/YheD family protein [Paenibacillus sp. GCM10027629]|uniref:YheC/YheD family protein n=1 Tax=Paenibacillus sp. GCM10027629 TaxID=3273414 RepID=UPI0036442744
MGAIVGVLLDPKTYAGIRSGKTGSERIALYQKAGQELGITPLFMSLRPIRNNVVVGLIYRHPKFHLVRRPIPSVTHNRAMALSKSKKQIMATLAARSTIFNRVNRFDKLHIYQLMYKEKRMRRFLPWSVKFTLAQLRKAMVKHNALYIKPTSSSVGEGIIKIQKDMNGLWILTWKKRETYLLNEDRAIAWIKKKVGRQKYMIQEAIQLAKHDGNVYDLRVSVQRGGDGRWQITGIVGKVAAKGSHVTNVAKGGKVKRTQVLFRGSGFHPVIMKRMVERSSLQMVKFLSTKLPLLADVGLDIGIDEFGQVKLIEMNCRDQRYSFRKANMKKTFYRTYETPLRYAKFLLLKKKISRLKLPNLEQSKKKVLQ